MTEGTARPPHTRTYVDKEGRRSIVEVDDHGQVLITEELLDQFFIGIGLTEITDQENPDQRGHR